MTIFDGGRESWTPPEDRGYTPGKDARDMVVWISAGLALLALVTVLAGCHSWPNCRPGGDCAPHGWLD
jgi:hypothetical protein